MAADNPPDEGVEYGFGELLRDIYSYLKPYRGRFSIAAALRLLGDLAGLYFAWALGQMTTFFSSYRPGEPIDYFLVLMGVWVVLGVFRFVSREACKYIGYQIGERMGIDARVDAIRHLFKLDIMWHEGEYAGSKMKRITNGSDAITILVGVFFDNVVEAVVSIVGISLILFSLDWRMSLMLLSFVVVYYLLSYRLSSQASRQARLVNLKEEALDGVSFEALGNIMTVKTMGIADLMIRRIVSASETLMAEIKRRILLFRTREAVLSTSAVIFRAAIMGYIGWGIYWGRFEVGVLIMFYTYFDRVMMATTEMSQVTDQVLVQRVALGRMRRMMQVKPTIELEGKAAMKPDWNELTVDHLSFSYGARSGALRDLSFKVRRGERVGIVGPSGAGKTTLFRLLLKLHEDYVGDIRLDGKSLKDIDRKSYMRRISVVLQDTEVFNMSLRENVEITGSDGDIQEALRISNLDEVLSRMPQGPQTMIGEKGVRLSGGERQRLGIARAIYKKPDILFLDEATSHLDSGSEEKIRQSLSLVFKDVTAIVIAHRLSTIREMDRILVMEHGEIAEEGTFDELVAKNGIFHDLWQKQKL